MTITAEIQSLDPGALIDLFILNATDLGGDLNRFHAHDYNASIFWQGHEYHPWPCEAEGFARDGDRPPTPTLRVGNINGSISALCMFFDDLVGAQVLRLRTLGKFLDAANFPGGNPDADPNEQLPPEIWYIERKVTETKEIVEFELVSGLELNGVALPRRQIIANLCPFTYRGADCNYTGGPVAKADDSPTSDPALDRCSKRLTGCKLRFGEDQELSFGGFPGAGLMRS